MILLVVIIAWIVLSLFGWSLLRAAAQADRNSSAQPMRPWADDLDVPVEDVRKDAASSVSTAHGSRDQGAAETRVRARA